MRSHRLTILTCGLGVGWILGLSVSPAVQIVVSSMAALVACVAGVGAGINEIKGKRFAFDPSFVAWLIFGLCAGAPLGILARTNELFGTNPRFFVWRWSGTQMPAGQLQKVLFDSLYAVKSTGKGETTNTPPANSVLGAALFVAISASDCAEMENEHGDVLCAHLKSLAASRYVPFLKGLNSNQLEVLKLGLCNHVQ